MQVSKQLNYSIKDIVLRTEDNRSLSFLDGKKLYDIPYFKGGAIIKVESKQPKLAKK